MRDSVQSRVYGYFTRLIDGGKLRPGDQLPTYPVIERDHKISHVTAIAVMRALRENLYIRTSNQGTFVYLSGPDRLYQILCNALNALEHDRQHIQMEVDTELACIVGVAGAVSWNPVAEQWERSTV